MSFFIILGIISAILVHLPYLFLPYMIASGGDTSTIGLMIKDASLGKFYTFFYGQAFNGPIEVYITAPFVRLFGFSNIAFFTGSMIIFSIFLVSTYFLASEFKGKRAGLYALFYCVVPPFYFYQHNIFMLGYHVTILILGNIIFLMTLKISKRNNRFIYYIIFGFTAGLGLWSHYSIFFYLIPCILFLILRVRFINLIKGGFAGIIPFIFGSLPYWIYNVKYGFRSFNLYDGHPCIWHKINASYWQVLNRYISFHVFGALEIKLDHILGWILLVLYVISLLNLLSRENRRNGWLFIFYIITVLFISVKNKFFIWVTTDDYRHALCFFAVIPLAVALTADRLSRLRRGFGVYFIAIFIAANGWQIIGEFKDNKNYLLGKYKRYEELIEFFNRQKIYGFISDFITTEDVNFITQEKIVGAEPANGRAPTDLEVDIKDKIAFVNYEEFKPDIKRLCYKWKEANINLYNVLYDFVPFPYYGEALDRSDWKTSSNSYSNLTKYAADGNLDRYWSIDKDKQKGVYFEIDFGSVYTIYKLEAINISPFYRSSPCGYKIEVSLDGTDWEEVARYDGQPKTMFWSGPRIYMDILSGRWQEIFKPVKARFLRITKLEDNDNTWMINEIFVYKYLGQKNFRFSDYLKSAEDVYDFLIQKDIKFVYTDYWFSGKIRSWSKDSIGTLIRFNECWPERENTSRLMDIKENTAIVAPRENEEIVDSTMESLNINCEKKVIGPYICYLFLNNMNEWEKYFFKRQKSLYWIGPGVCRINSYLASTVFSDYSTELGQRSSPRASGFSPPFRVRRPLGLGQDKLDEKNFYLLKAIEISPNSSFARSKLARYNEGQRLELEREFRPDVETDIEFENGVKFRGYKINQDDKGCRIDYFWELSEDLYENVGVFAHFVKDSRVVFQNDHMLLEQHGSVIGALPGELLIERYWLEGLEPGRYEIKIGLVFPDNKKRLGIKGTGFHKATHETVGEIEIR